MFYLDANNLGGLAGSGTQAIPSSRRESLSRDRYNGSLPLYCNRHKEPNAAYRIGLIILSW